jgi:hypothetical protein
MRLMATAHGAGSENARGEFRVRQWIYLGPIIAAPMTHIAVTLYRKASQACSQLRGCQGPRAHPPLPAHAGRLPRSDAS